MFCSVHFSFDAARCSFVYIYSIYCLLHIYIQENRLVGFPNRLPDAGRRSRRRTDPSLSQLSDTRPARRGQSTRNAAAGRDRLPARSIRLEAFGAIVAHLGRQQKQQRCTTADATRSGGTILPAGRRRVRRRNMAPRRLRQRHGTLPYGDSIPLDILIYNLYTYIYIYILYFILIDFIESYITSDNISFCIILYRSLYKLRQSPLFKWSLILSYIYIRY